PDPKPPDPVDERPVLPEKKPPPPKPAPPPPPRPTPPPPKPPPPRAEPAPAAPASPFARRQGAPTGDPLGVSKRPTIGVEDPNFTYGYYLDRVVALIRENWVRPQTGATDALVHFRVLRDGTITDVALRRTSGDAVFDRAALRAVEASSPLPPLPKGYQRDDLGINLIVK
ncbi:MAG: energy transducer TonB, partial [Acidobacteriota bacterium]